MEFEHFALNVKDPKAVAKWYAEHLQMTIVHQDEAPPYMTFLTDRTGRTVLELYHHPGVLVPDYANQHHLQFHFAFKVADAQKESQHLLHAGCTTVETISKPDGSILVMMRDPWGLALQLCQRHKPLSD